MLLTVVSPSLLQSRCKELEVEWVCPGPDLSVKIRDVGREIRAFAKLKTVPMNLMIGEYLVFPDLRAQKPFRRANCCARRNCKSIKSKSCKFASDCRNSCT